MVGRKNDQKGYPIKDMKNINLVCKETAVSDIDTIITFMHEYYDYEGIQFDEKNAGERLEKFFNESGLGKIWLIHINNHAEGYIVVTHGFGLEHGPNVWIDEFYIRESFTGHGVGRQVIRFIEGELSSMGISAIHTEVERKNQRARAFWKKIGFHAYDRYPMTKMIKNT